ncbi:SAM-dependent methyltransferase [Streptomyces diacarni]|uniref:SAM-dependent methyltransferase n=1 Tax=Streptomyces diacarni TaxID=2800381 RepID=A0A367EUZ6_9ACTN|nr:SAM-dependent methyltransferase [Streptomyces diacarni]RCG21529.1 SAM-dependent methyltransferase [Streptomyces diacarni]
MREELAGADDFGVDAVDVTVPSVSRMYDHYLGGKDNYAVDREAVAALDRKVPGTRALALDNRSFLRRVVHVLSREYGVRQFIDHGSGLPTQDNVHQVAQRVDGGARVVYVDNDPIVLAHGRALLEENARTAVIRADMRDTDAIFDSPEVGRLIDRGAPVALLFVSVMHCLPDASDPVALVERVMARVPSGSFIVLNQLVSLDAETREFVTDFMGRSTQGQWGRVREPHEVAGYFAGLDVIDPGLVEITGWRPDSDLRCRHTDDVWFEYGGVARKR